jgi:adenine deaminase
VRRLHAAGARVHAGSDAIMPHVVPGVSLHEELRELTAAGLDPEEAWAAATRVAGGSLREPMLGTLRPGAPADLLVFREDPTRDLGALETLEAVVVRGRLYPTAWLDRALARYHVHYAHPLYDALNIPAARRAGAAVGLALRMLPRPDGSANAPSP